MRLTKDQVDYVARSIRNHLGHNAKIWIFGSRLDDRKKGGDLDLYVETQPCPLHTELRCKIELEEALGLPVDLIIRTDGDNTPIACIAKRQGKLI